MAERDEGGVRGAPRGALLRATVAASWAAGGLTAAFLALLVMTPLFGPLPGEWTGAADYAREFRPLTMLAIVPSLLLAPTAVVLLAGLHGLAAERDRAWTRVALAFGVVYCGIVAANDYLQLTTVSASLVAGETAGLDPLVWTNPRGVFAALEVLGYAFLGAATLALVPSIRGGPHGRTLRRLFAANGAISLLPVPAQVAGSFALVFPGLVLWSVAFGAAMVLQALRLQRLAAASFGRSGEGGGV